MSISSGCEKLTDSAIKLDTPIMYAIKAEYILISAANNQRRDVKGMLLARSAREDGWSIARSNQAYG